MPLPLRFTKMHGIGNDYIYVDGFAQRVSSPAAVARRISDRHTGVGGDGLILILPPSRGVRADVRMRMFNADGSESEMCGNGVRCVCKYAFDHGLSRARPMRIQTGRGVLKLDFTRGRNGCVDEVTVDMGKPIVAPSSPLVSRRALKKVADTFFEIEAGGMPLRATFVSMGNPHAVFFADENPRLMPRNLARLEVAKWGPLIERHKAFPRRINAHFVDVHSKREATMRTWERGTGITMACGTGACAVAVAGAITGRLSRNVLVHLPGGDLLIEWDRKSGHVFMTGPAVEVFSGVWSG